MLHKLFYGIPYDIVLINFFRIFSYLHANRKDFSQKVASIKGASTMAHSKEYTDEQLNYYRICCLTTDILAEGLREIFKQEWDKLYKTTKGEWKDEPRNGMDFFNGESPRNQKRNARLLATIKNGNSEEWDCTMLFYVILFSDCVGPGLSATVRKNVDDLRNFRNEEFAHIPQGSLSEIDFQNAISKVDVAFQALSLPTVKIQDLKCQKTFPTKDLTKVLKQVDNLKQEVQEKESQRQVIEDQLQNEAHSFCVLPPKPSHEIGGREREVAKLVQQLRELNESSDNRLSYLYISGNPGSGKSQLAGLIAERFFDDLIEMPGGSSFVMTLNAASPDSLLESYASFARHLKCPEYSVMETLSSKDSTVDEKITSLKMLVTVKIKCYTSWLLVVDNVTTLSSVHVHLPQFKNEAWARGQLVITTQDTTSIPSESSFVNHISASKGMETSDARSLLSKLSGIPDSELVGTVAQRLDYQPLALAGAAVFVKEIRQDKVSTHFGWEEYMKILEKGKRQKTEDTLVDTNPIYPNSMTKAITLAVQTLMRSDKFQKHLFTSLALCAPRPLNMDIAVSYIMNAHEEFDEADKELIRMRLKRSSLLLFQDDEGGCFIRVHQVVHDAIVTVAKEYAESQSEEVISGVITSFNEFIVATLPENERLNTRHIAPHLKALTIVTDNVLLRDNFIQVHDEEISEKCENLGNICKMHCEFEEAKTYFEYSLTFKLQELGPEHVDVARSYSNLASIYQDLGDFEQAKEYQQRALDIEMDKLGPEHVNVATSYNNLAMIYKDLGDFEQAKEYQQRALDIELDKLGPEHVNVARSYCNLATIYQHLVDFEQAKEYQQRALDIELDKLGLEHVNVATSYSNLAMIYQHLCYFEQAKEYQQRALDIQLDKLGPEHVNVGGSYSNLASIYRYLGDFEQAKDYQQRALDIQLDKLGPEHVDVARSYNNLAVIYKDLSEFEQAKKYQQLALDIEVGKLGLEHVDVARSYSNLASIYRDLGDFEQAKEYQKRALYIELDKLGPGHVYVARNYNNLAMIYKDLGDFKEAKEYQQRALDLELDKLGPEHVNVARSYGNLASIYRDLGDLEQAKEYQQSALDIELDKLGPEHVNVARSYDNLASIYQDLGDFEQAREYQQRALDIELDKLGAEHVNVARSYRNLASIYQHLGDFEQAKEYQQRALDIEMDKLGPEHVNVATSYNNLAMIYKDLGDFEQAKEYQQRALDIQLDKLGAEHVNVAGSYNNLASIYQDLGDFERAREYQQRALDIQLDKLGPEHVNVARSYSNLAVIYQDLGDFEQAKEYQQRALDIKLDKLGPEHVNVATSYNNLAVIYKYLGDFEQAKEYQQRALDIELGRLGPEHVNVARSYNNLAVIYKYLGDFEQAKEYQQRALHIDLDKLGAEHVNVARSYSNLALIYQDLGDLEEAREYQQLALAISADKHRFNKTPNKVHERLLTDAKYYIM